MLDYLLANAYITEEPCTSETEASSVGVSKSDRSTSDQMLEDTVRTYSGKIINLSECLTLADIFSLNLNNCRLVTLSACETGLPDVASPSDEYVGLPNSFLYAGSPSVVSSLWVANDISTAFLMIKFYENLHNHSSVALALNQAQLWLREVNGDELQQWIREKQIPVNLAQMTPTQRINFQRILARPKPFQNPYYWAAFCAIGQ